MKTMSKSAFPLWLKTLAVFLAILLCCQVLPFSVWAADYTESERRKAYFEQALSGYLKQIVDTDNAVSILEYDQVNKENADGTNTSGGKTSDSYAINAASDFEENGSFGEEASTGTSTTEDISLETLTVEKEDGENVSYVFSEPISYLDENGKLVFKDTGIYAISDRSLRRAGYAFENGANDYKIYFSKTASTGILLQPNDSNKIYISPKADKKAKAGELETLTDDGHSYQAISYENAFGRNTSLRYSAQLNGSKEEIILNKKPKNNTFSFTLKTENAIAAINSYGDVEIIDTTSGNIVDTLTAPFAYDSSGGFDSTSEHYTDCTYTLEEQQAPNTEGATTYTLTITIPEDYLSAETTEYPVIIDPTSSNLSMRFDTALYSGKPTISSGSNATANFGRSPSYGYGWAMFYFLLPDGLKSYANINSAKLYVRETTGSTSNIVCYPYLITSSWSESSTWNSKPSYTRTFTLPGSSSSVSMPTRVINSKSTDVSGSKYWYAMDISYAVKAWTSGKANKGVLFASTDTNSTNNYLWRAFATKEHSTSSYRPYAVISYTNDTTAPTISKVEGNATAYTSGSVTLKVTATDNVYGVQYYSFDNGSTWQTSNQKTFSSNQTVVIKAKDYAGNISSAKTVTIDKIDKQAPEIDISLDPEEDTYGTVTATISVTDNANLQSVSVNGEEESASGQNKDLTKIYDQNGVVSVTAVDSAGNTATVSKSIENILLATADTTAPSKPDIYEEENQIFVRARSFTFDEDSESPEETQYKIGDGEWQEYTEPLDLLVTADTAISARVKDAAGNVSEEASFLKKSRMGEYAVSFTDMELGSGLLPFTIGRTYSSVDGWHFTWNATLEETENGYIYTDFTGNKHYYLSDAAGRYVNKDGKELQVEDGTALEKAYHFKLEEEDLTCYFDADRLLVAVENGNTQATFTRTENQITIADKIGGTIQVSLNTDGNPVRMIYTALNGEEGPVETYADRMKMVEYYWKDGTIGNFTDAQDTLTLYVYEDGKMTSNGDTSIEYSNGRVKRIIYKDNSFVRYTYDDTAASKSANTPGNLGKVTMDNSKGVTDYYYYADGFDAASMGFDSYSEAASYHPEQIDSAVTTGDAFSSLCYVVEKESESSNEDDTEENATDADGNTDSGNTEARKLYEQNDDGSYSFFLYDDDDQLIEEVLVPAGALSITGETTYAQAEAVATKKYSYSYTSSGNLATYAILGNTGIWLQEYGEEYTYDTIGNIWTKQITYTDYAENTETGELVPTTRSSEVDYTYNDWAQCVRTVYSASDAEQLTIETQYDCMGRESRTSTQESFWASPQITDYTYDRDGNVLTVSTEGEKTTYTYANGKVQSRTDANQSVASYTYDLFGNLTNHSYNGYTFSYNTLGSILTAGIGNQTLATYTYSADTNQNVLSASFGNGNVVNYVYNEEKELIEIKEGEDSRYQFSYEKNSAGDITVTNATEVVNQVVRILEENKTTVKEGEDALYTVETLEKSDTDSSSVNGTRITIGTDLYQLVSGDRQDVYSKNETTNFTRNIEKDRNGNIITSTLKVTGQTNGTTGNSVSTTYGYGVSGAVTTLENTLNGLNVSYNYGYNTDGNVTSETMTKKGKGSQGETQVSTEQTAYTYDSKGQLISAENNTTKWEYAYDTRGNLLSRKEYAVTTNSDGTKSYSEKVAEAASYTYDTAWKDKLVSYQGQSISYDAIGNPTSYLGKTLSWTMGRQLSSMDNIEFTYNSDGIRTSKTNGSITTKYYLNGTDVIYQTDGTNSLYFYYDGDGNVIGFDYANNLYYYVKNMQGDIVGIADANGAMQTEYTYDPWGKVLSVTGNETLGNLNPFRYRSCYYDTETSLYYLQSRYYDPQVGRFLNSDDVNYIGTTESELSYNPFAYCENDPVNASDPTGTIKLSTFVRTFFKGTFKYRFKSWKWSLAVGMVGLLASLKKIKKDIGAIHKITKDKLATAMVTAIPYASTYLTKSLVSKLVKAAVIAMIADIVFEFVTLCYSGGVSITIKRLIKACLPSLLPSLWTSAQIIYYSYKYHKKITFSLNVKGPKYSI